MSELVRELRLEHAQISDTLKKVLELGFDSEEGRNLLISAKAYLIAHLGKEDKKLYPVLWKEAETNFELRKTLESYASEMDKISQFALTFFEKCSLEGNAQQFENEFKKLFRMLNTRILNEESVLYKKYDEIAS